MMLTVAVLAKELFGLILDSRQITQIGVLPDV